MFIVLSQRIDTDSAYEDIPFQIYHFPKRYINQINPGDKFIYYQGDRQKRKRRYYYGCGVIGDIFPSNNNTFLAYIIESKSFPKIVPIYQSGNNFYESVDFSSVRKSSNPAWQRSVRKISEAAFNAILTAAEIDASSLSKASIIETVEDPLSLLIELNKQYSGITPKERALQLQSHIDRGASVTKALKQLLGCKCQICGWQGFKKYDSTDFIEAHHLAQISERKTDSLCTENIILVCPNCHREIHYGKNVGVSDVGENIIIKLSNKEAHIPKNTISFLKSLNVIFKK
jgi:hypothetical protein